VMTLEQSGDVGAALFAPAQTDRSP
jgi:hypothetical protein